MADLDPRPDGVPAGQQECRADGGNRGWFAPGGTRSRLRPTRGATWVLGTWTAVVLTYVAQPPVALLWAGGAITGAIVLLADGHPARSAAVAALVLAAIGLLWTLVQLGALY